MVKPAVRKQSVLWLVNNRPTTIERACGLLSISRSVYYYQSRLQPENERIATWLMQLTQWQRNWGFGLCYLYLRNVKGYGWNHKRVYRIYCELELNLRITNLSDELSGINLKNYGFLNRSMSHGQWILCMIN